MYCANSSVIVHRLLACQSRLESDQTETLPDKITSVQHFQTHELRIMATLITLEG
jgi:hypothetical protein